MRTELIRAEVFDYDSTTGRGLFIIRSGGRVLGLVRFVPMVTRMPFDPARGPIYLCGSGCLQGAA